MLSKLFYNCLFALVIIEVTNTLKVYSENNNNSLINKFCVATLKSKINIKHKKNFHEISHYSCECFFKRYKSGSSIKDSRNYCRDKTAEKYNL